jgi:hypothetical protein
MKRGNVNAEYNNECSGVHLQLLLPSQNVAEVTSLINHVINESHQFSLAKSSLHQLDAKPNTRMCHVYT